MREISLEEAQATLSAMIDDAVQGRPSIITRHGEPQVVVLGFTEWERLSGVPSFGRLLLSAPLEPEDLPERNPGAFRPMDV
ncbi:prevent-host-death protein [Skermanella stibiiresistens SB22]|uniref:Antitoxin n=1 Tax=Skermanella stibiiresistens SB22 TaxID=1385369 RepID=W9H4A1_9PROT|nr:type II toxin-antitoxin system Phd/YefM family antitoxin [Skermanella stibiiresistens]EWY41045.1 prevent-host-death protein [Skermanella stibiiresistens SB22]